jgi:hypothetical protein
MPDEQPTLPDEEPAMPDEQPAMPDEQPTIHDPAGQDAPALAYEPTEEEDEWLDEPDELPPRPRRRLLTPIPLALLGVLLIAGGFIAGVQVQKGEETPSGSSGGAGASLASRFAGLRGGGTSSTGASSGKTPAGGAAGGFPGTGAGGARPTTGTVAYLAGNTLYVTNPEGNTVKVNTSAGTSVTTTVKTKVTGIHPGETVTVIGATGSSGAVSAESISVGSSSGGLAGLFGGSAKSSTGAGTAGGGGAPALFGSG